MTPIFLIAGKEIREGSRNRWALAATTLLAALALGIVFLGSAPTGTVGAGALDVTIVSLVSLTILIIPLIALLLAHDSIVGEVERGTLALLLSYPLQRRQILMGKFLGQVTILAGAIVAGYGLAALTLVLAGNGEGDWPAFLVMLASSILLGAVFVSLGLLVSVLANDRGMAAGIAAGLWLGFAILYDMILLGLLASDTGGHLGRSLIDGLLLLNPTDSYRLLNLAGSSGVAVAAGMSGSLDSSLGAPILLLSMLLWIAAPLVLAAVLFARKEL